MRFLQRILKSLVNLFVAALLPLSLFAETTTQQAPSPSGKKDPHRQSISFEDELVEGSTQKPELFYLFQKKNFNYKRLIKLRENFIPEARRSTEDIQRGRGSN